MKKNLLLAFYLLLSSLILTSAPIDTALSKRVAVNFYRERIGSDANPRGVPMLVKTYKAAPASGTRDSLICLYIYNVGDGYVIVSGDDRVKPVLGYSTEGQFDPQNMPIQLKEWLLGYVAEIQSVMNTPTFVNSEAAANWSRLASPNFTPSRYGTVVVAPLIQSCWDQHPYYNNLCPMIGSERTVTGCVATAMAQMLYYWKYPSHGFGSHSYTHATCGVQSADFAAATYNYDLMPTSLNSSSSATEVFEVAQLMYHCGVSVDMDYGLSSTGGSGASTATAADAFNTYFGYSCMHRGRSSAGSDAQWISDLKAELNNARPLLYNGSGPGGGHAFICDGYTADNYFHFNFGWSCAYDGYYTLDNINPNPYTFNDGHGAIFNMSAANPILLTNPKTINFFTENSVVTEGRKVSVLTHSLSNNITITTNSPFAVSLDSVNYSTSISLSSSGGNFYVRYQPAFGNQNDAGTVSLVSGSKSASIDLQGFSCTISCLPPQDLAVSSTDLQHLHLSWSAPQVDNTEQTLSWNDRALSYTFTYGSSQLTMLQRFNEADLISYHGQSLTKITSYIVDGATTVKLVVFKGGSYMGSSIEPGSLVYEQTVPISSVTQGAWNTFNLSTPVPIEASQELWFGIYLESTATYPIPIGPTYTPQKGAIIGLGSMSNTLWRDLDYLSLCILGTVQNTQSISHYEVSRDGTVLGNTNNIYYDDVVSSTNTYHYNVAAVWDNGCTSSASITVANIASVYANPDILAFHNNAGLNIQVKKTVISSMGLSSNIQATVTSPFQISSDSVNFSTSKTLPASGGTLYVRYNPSTYPTTPDHGTITLTSGSATAQVQLVGQGTGDCNPPQNLTLSAPTSGTTVTATWNAPDAMSVNTYDLTWHVANINNYTTYNNLTLYALQRFEPSDLAPYHNKKITTISFIPNTDYLTTCKVVVFKGGTWSSTASSRDAGTLVAEQVVPISSINDWVWNTVTLNTPVVIDANQELWFGIYLEYSQTCSSPRFGSTATANKSAIYRNGTNNWASNNSRSFAIKASVEDNNPTFDHYHIDRNGSVLVNNTTSTSYVDNVGISGDYDYTVWAVWSDGCQSGITGSVSVTGGCTAPGTVTVHDQCGGTYTWHGTTYSASGTYTYAFTNSNNCQQVDTLRLNIHSAPSITISGNTSTCSGASATLTASGANSYSWSTGASGNSITVNPTSSTTYTVTGTDSHGCTGNATVTVSVTSCIPTGDAQPCPGHETVTDYDGNVYSTVKVGNQCWMKENLRTTHYANGAAIPLGGSNSSNTNSYYYINSSLDAATYGYYYNWPALMHGVASSATNPSGVQGVCPTGWHVPSDAEWTQLTDYVSSVPAYQCGSSTNIVKALASEMGWDSYGGECYPGDQTQHANNATGFSAVPAGTCTGSSFGGASLSALFWSSTQEDNYYYTNTWGRILSYNTLSVIRSGGNEASGFSVRCLLGAGVSLSTVTTNSVSNIAQTSATCGGNVTADGGATVTARGVCWSTSHNPTVSGSHTTDGSGTGTFTSSITGLTPNTTYFVRAYATNSAGTAYGEEKSFTTACNTVTVSISGNSSIEYGQSTTLTASGASTYMWSTGENTASITVSPASTTTYTVTGTNQYGCTGEASKTVTVSSLAPTVITSSVSNIAQTSATCGGNVTATGGATVTARGVCWSTSHNPTVSGSHTTDGSGIGSFTSSITGLTPNTTYFVRAYATNSAGTAYGEEKSFTTACNTVTVTISGNSSIEYGQSTTLTASGASTYAWSTGESTAIITVSPTSTTTYTVTGTNQYGCTGEASKTVTVNSLAPTVITSNVSNIAQTSAACGGNVTANGGATVTARGVCWSASHNPTVSGSHTTDGSGTGTFTSSITGLTPNTTYYVRAYATNSAGTAYGEEKSFTTACNTVTVTISGNGSIEYGQSTTLTASGASTYAWSTGATTNSITVSPTSTTTYTVTGTNQYGCTASASKTVTVSSLAPTVITSNVSDIAQTSATCGGNVTATGGATVTARGVCWSTSHNPTVSGSHTTDDSGTGTFTSNITGLTPNTTYFVRAYATNSAGTAYGEEKSFLTSSCPTIEIRPLDTVWLQEPLCPTYGHFNVVAVDAATGIQIPNWMIYWSGEAVDYTSTNCFSFIAINENICDRYYTITVHAMDTINGCTEEASFTVHALDTASPVFNGTLPDGHICKSSDGKYHIPDFTSYFTDQTVSDNCYSFSDLTITQNPAAGTEILSNTQVTITLSAPCGPSQNIIIEVEPVFTSDTIFEYSICESELPFIWHGHTFTESGTYYDTLTAINGCDSIVTLHLIIHNQPTIAFLINDVPWITRDPNNYFNCENKEIKIGIVPNGWERVWWSNAYPAGCETCEPVFEIVIVPNTIHAGLTYSYCVSAIDSNGCRAIEAINVIAKPITLTVFDTVICQNQLPFVWNSRSLTEAGTYSDTLMARNGCDSVVTLHLVVINCGPVIDSKSCPAAPTVTDHEGNVYATVQIGSQCWMRDNLRTTTSPSTGTHLIPPAGTTYTYTGKQAFWYNNDSTTYAPMNYGLLYNWNAAVDTFNTAYGETSVNSIESNSVSASFAGNRRGICPAGWHLPSDAEWNTMEATVSSSDWQASYETYDGWRGNHAGKLAVGDYWANSSTSGSPGDYNNADRNASGFSAVPAGSCHGSWFGNAGINAFFWSCTEISPGYAYQRHLWCGYAYVDRNDYVKYFGYSVRCIRDAGIAVIDSKSCPAAPTVTDHEGNVYATVQIGNQCWMRDNLRTTTSPSTGTYLIPASNANYTYTGKQARWYNNDSITYDPMNYGLLYNWNAAVDTFNTTYGETSVNTDYNNAVSVTFSGPRRGICPAGWHLPSDTEWNAMERTVSDTDWQIGYETTLTYRGNHAGKLVGGDNWYSNSSSTAGTPGDYGNIERNNTGFSAVPAGLCTYSSFRDAGRSTYFWSSSQNAGHSYGTYYRNLDCNYTGVGRGSGFNYCGFSVRCLRDENNISEDTVPVLIGNVDTVLPVRVLNNDCKDNLPARNVLLSSLHNHFNIHSACGSTTPDSLIRFYIGNTEVALANGTPVVAEQDIFANTDEVHVTVRVEDECHNITPNNAKIHVITLLKPAAINIAHGATLTPDYEVCNYDTVVVVFDANMIYNGFSPYQYSWNQNPKPDECGIIHLTDTSIRVHALVGGANYTSTQFIMNITDKYGCKASDTSNAIHFFPVPTVNLVEDPRNDDYAHAEPVVVCPTFGHFLIEAQATDNLPLSYDHTLTYVWSGEAIDYTSRDEHSFIAVNENICHRIYTAYATVTNTMGCITVANYSIDAIDTEAPVLTVDLTTDTIPVNAPNCKIIVPDYTHLFNVNTVSDNCWNMDSTVVTQVPAAGTLIGVNTDVVVTVHPKCGPAANHTIRVCFPEPFISTSISATVDSACYPYTTTLTTTTLNGTPAYTVVWNGTDAVDALVVSPTETSRTHNVVVVTDAHGCQATDAIDLVVYHKPPVPNMVIVPNTSCAASNGSVRLVNTDPKYYYTLNGITWRGNQGARTFGLLPAGSYNLNIYNDITRCSNDTTIVVPDGTVIPTFSANEVNIQPRTNCVVPNGQIHINAQAGHLYFVMNANGDTISAADYNAMAEGEYIVRKYNFSTGCFTDMVINIPFNRPVFNYTLSHVNDKDCSNEIGTGSISVTPASAAEYHIYNSLNEEVTFTGLNPDTYTVTAHVAATQCTYSKTEVIATDYTYPQLVFTSTPNYNCYPEKNGTITAIDNQIHVNYSSFTYYLDGEAVNYPITGLNSGVYNVYALTNYHCSSNVENVVVVDSAFFAREYNIVPNSTCDITLSRPGNGQIHVLTPQSTHYLYVFTYIDTIHDNYDADHFEPIDYTKFTLADGHYSFHITDTVTGCEYTDTVFVPFVATPLTIDSIASTPDYSCRADLALGTITVIAHSSSASAVLTYSIDNGATYQMSNVFTGLVPGTYNIVIRDTANKCIYENLPRSVVDVASETIIPLFVTNEVSTQARTNCVVPNGQIHINAQAGYIYFVMNADGDTISAADYNAMAEGDYIVRKYNFSTGCFTDMVINIPFDGDVSACDGQPCPGAPTVTDIDGNVYNTVQIGDQCWMRENLRTTRYANGTTIALGSGNSDATAYRYYPNNNSDNVASYGYLYNWTAVMHGASATDLTPSGVQGICPTGWHVPSVWEWSLLTFYIRSQNQYFCSNNSLYFAKSLASTTGWNESSVECGVGNNPSTNNATNFSVLPAGYYYGGGNAFGTYTYLWSTSESEDENVNSYGFCNDQAFAATISNTYKRLGLSVRCLRDENNTSATLPTVTTDTASNIAETTATCGGNVTSNGGATVTIRGICWNTTGTPTISDARTTDGTGTGPFTSNITGLTPNTTYFVRAFAINGVGTAYGNEVCFTTPADSASDGQPCPSAPTVTDYDGNIYNTVKIGQQCWMKENMRTTHYADGMNIGTSSSLSSSSPLYYTTPGDVAVYGLLYNLSAATRGWQSNSNPSLIQGICPTGWHVPSYNEVLQLKNYVINDGSYSCGGNSNYIAKALASTVGWPNTDTLNACAVANNPAANNLTGFSFVPHGYFFGEYGGGFGSTGYSWTTTSGNTSFASGVYYDIDINSTTFIPNGTWANAAGGLGVRCIKGNTLATVTTSSVSDIAATTATCGGTVLLDGGETVTAYGVCWSTSLNPTVSGYHTTDGNGTNTFTSLLTGLTPSTTYYVRAYATNSLGTAYGETISFTTDVSCSAPENITITDVSATSVNVEWSGNADSYTLRYRTPGDSVIYFFDDFENGINNWSVIRNSGGNEQTDWQVFNGSFTSSPITAHSGSNMMMARSWNNGAYNVDNWLITPAVTLDGTLSFWVMDDGTYHEHYDVYVSTSGNNINDFSLLYSPGNATSTWTKVSVDLSGFQGITGYIALRLSDYDQDFLMVDDFSIIDYTIAAGEWQPYITTDSNSVIISGLLPETEYEVQVQADCDDEGVSAWSSAVRFTTHNTIPAGDAQPCPGHETVTDYDGNVYNTVKIGQQCWMKENLRTTHFADGVAIPAGTTTSETVPYRYAPNNDTNNVTNYGYLYNWPAFMHGAASSDGIPSGVQGICPAGWHVPSYEEWGQLDSYVYNVPAYGCGGSGSDVKALAATTGWNIDNGNCTVGNDLAANNASGFGALPAGFYNGTFNAFGNGAYFWSTTGAFEDLIWSFAFAYLSDYAEFGSTSKDWGTSVRCILGDGANPPAVTTNTVVNIGANTAISGGNVTTDGGATVTTRGVCWNTTGTPTVSDSHTTDGTGTGTFTSSLTGLTPNTTYYVRAYATNSVGTAYGETVTFTTECPPVSVILGDSIICNVGELLFAYVMPAVDPNTQLLYTWYKDNAVVASGSTDQFLASETGYYKVAVSNNGCTSESSDVYVILPNTPQLQLTASGNNICEDGSAVITAQTTGWHMGDILYSWSVGNHEGTSYTFVPDHVGTFTITVTATDVLTNCESNASITINVFGQPDITISGNTDINYGQSTTLTASGASTYTWSTGESTASINVTPTITTSYSVTGTSQHGCTGTASVTVTVNTCVPTLGSEETAEACDSYTWHGATFTESGDYTDTMITAAGCDSVITLHLTIYHSTGSGLDVTACDWFFWNDSIYTTSGVYMQYFQTVHGCDSTVVLHLTIYQSKETEWYETACDSFTWNGQTYHQSGTYVQYFPTVPGCDSIVVLHLTIYQSKETEWYETACDSYTWNGQTYYQSGTYVQYFPTVHGCDSTVMLNLTIHNAVTNQFAETVCDSYTWNGQTYAQSGDYTQQFQTVHGCDSTVMLNLTIHNAVTNQFNETACDSYTWNSQTYHQSGDYVQHFTTINGCDSTVTLHLAISDFAATEFTTAACGSYTWNGQTYTQSGDYVQHFQTIHGCDSAVTLHLTINNAVTHQFAETACDSYTWNSQTYHQSGDYVQHFTTINGCDSTVTLHLAISDFAATEFTTAACGSYTWNGQTYTQSGDYVQHFQTIHGCDSAVTLHLTINNAVTHQFAETACDSYTWNGQTYTQSGDYIQQFQTVHGCDSTVTLHMTIHNAVTSQFNETACDSYTWNGQTYHQSGDYVQYFQTVNGCDSTVTLHLTIHNAVTQQFSITACDSYTWNGQTYTQSGDYIQQFQTVHGCDSTVTLHMTIHNAVTSQFNETACDSYTWNGQTYHQSGDYVQYFQTVNGCDSTVTLHLTIHNAVTQQFSITACDSYTWNSQTYHQSGDYVQHFLTVNGCDSSVTLHLTIHDAVTHQFSQTACDSYIWNGQTYYQSGDYVQHFQTIHGCDSTVTLHLTIHNAVTYQFSETACDSYTWNGQTYHQSGDYMQHFTTVHGCDSTVTLHLTIHNAATSQFSETACDSYTWNGQTYTQSGDYTQHFQTVNGCDSTVTLHLTIHNAATYQFSETACDNYTWNGQTYTQSGDYMQHFTTVHGCDSTVTLHLTIHNAVTRQISITACDSYTWNGQTYHQSGDFVQYFQTIHGCDSTVTLHLTIHNAATYQFSETACDSYTWNGQTYHQSGDYMQHFTTVHGCDSTVTLHLTIHNAATYQFSETACDSYTWNGQTYHQSGDYMQHFTTVHGCDSTVTLHLTIHNAATYQFSETACDSYTWNGQTYHQSGDYMQHFTTVHGCDSTVTLHLTIHNAATYQFSETACDSYTWNGQTYHQSGDYVQYFQTVHGCDSTVTLHLTIHNAVTRQISITACDSYTWNGQTYHQSGDYVQHFQTVNGCDSTVTLHLTISDFAATEFTAEACGSFTWNGQTYHQSGNYVQHFTTVNGCDSTVTLHLTVSYDIDTVFLATACDSYTWNGQTYHQSGDFVQHFQTVNGCDSTVTLHLIVHYSNSTEFDTTVCDSYTWNGQPYHQSGDYMQHFTTVHGCDSTVTLHLTISDFAATEFTAEACGSFTWNGQTYHQSGNYVQHFTTVNGCDSTVTLHLTVSYDIDTVFLATACDSYTWNGQTYHQSGDFVQHFQTVNGCDSTVTLHLTIHNAVTHQFSITACDSYIWNGQTYHQSGDFVQYFQTIHGCDSTVTLHLTIHNAVTHQFSETACDSYIWNGQTYHQSGDYVQHFQTVNGCDSTVTLHLTIYNAATYQFNETSCDSYTWNGQTYYQSGDFVQHFTTIHGCDSTVTLHLTIHNAVTHQFSITACDSYTWNGQTYHQSGDFVQHFQTVNGCDSTVTLHLTIHNAVTHQFSITACGSYTWNGQTYHQSGDFVQHFQTVNGCDSTVTLHLTIHNAATYQFSGTACDSYTWNGQTYHQSGDFVQHFQTVHGCDSTVTLHLTIHNAVTQQFSITACDSYTWNGQTYHQSGTYVQNFQTVHGCDSTVTLHLTIHNAVTHQFSETACDSYIWNGQTYHQSGTYVQNFQTVHGCDSTVTLHLTIHNAVTHQFSETACDSYIWNGQTYYQSGDFVQHFTTIHGCDSTVTLHLTIHNAVTHQFSETACDSYIWNGQTYHQSGDYVQHFQTVNGCDSTVTLHLTIYNAATYQFNETACDSYTWNGQTYHQSGDFVQHFQTIHGCDSAVTLHLTIHDAVTHQLSETACDSYIWNGQTYYQSGDYVQHFQTIHGCDSMVILHLTIHNAVTYQFAETACESYTWNGQTYYQSGNYVQHLQTIHGCDSAVTLHLTILQSPTVTIMGNTSFCEGNSSQLTATGGNTYQWSTGSTQPVITVSQSGTYVVTATNTEGCSATASVVVTVNPLPQIVISGNTTICAGNTTVLTASGASSYVWSTGAQTASLNVDAFGMYSVTGTSVDGCSGTASVVVLVNQPPVITITGETEVCRPDTTILVAQGGVSYIWSNGDTSAMMLVDAPGVYQVMGFDAAGCYNTTSVTVHYWDADASEVTISVPDSCYEWNNEWYCQSGDYVQTLQNIHGCDSVVTLHLTLHVGIGSHSVNNITLYPNPTRQSVQIRNSGSTIRSVTLFDASGRMLNVVNVNDHTAVIDLSAYAAGTYFLRIMTENGVVTKRVVKQ